MVDENKRTLSEEHKQKMAEGRRRAAEKKAAKEDKAEEGETAVDKAKKRPRRTPLWEAKDIMTVDGIPDGYIGRWVNDTDNNVMKLQERGYEFVMDTPNGRVTVGEKRVDPNRQTGSVVSKIVGNDKNGKPLTAYLMVQRQEWYEEDQQYKQSEIDQVVKQIVDRNEADGLMDTDSREYKRA